MGIRYNSTSPEPVSSADRTTPYPTQVHRHVTFDSDSPEYLHGPEPVESDSEQANVSTSEVANGRDPFGTQGSKHKLLIDIDLPCKLIPSTHEGHFHLFIDKEIDFDKLKAVLIALSDAGIVEPGYVGASLARGYTAVRLPWIKKK